MARYLVQAPDKNTLVVSGLYGVHKFKHDSIMFSDEIARLYPQYFFQIPEEGKISEHKKVVTEIVEKRKAGRSKKKG